mmetsp:Transcript_37135/g.27448  ORF Transcript_37135/g.27448 Transcript_37135/m.27448 type:complete len:98 (+) Transcript_37135:59-352(+)
MAADRYNFNKSWEYIQSKHVGTGHSDSTKFEWTVNQHRDTYASYLGHYDMTSYFAVAQNDSIGRVRYQLLEKMLQPCGPPPPREDDAEPDGGNNNNS